MVAEAKNDEAYRDTVHMAICEVVKANFPQSVGDHFRLLQAMASNMAAAAMAVEGWSGEEFSKHKSRKLALDLVTLAVVESNMLTAYLGWVASKAGGGGS